MSSTTSSSPAMSPAGPSGAEIVSAQGVRGLPVKALSPSRASDFMQCPLLYRFRVIDRIAETPSPAAVRGTVVHAVLEKLFDLPAEQRTLDAALAMIGPAWARVRQERPEVSSLFAEVGTGDAGDAGDAEAQWLQGAGELVRRWFGLEDPTRLEPAERELYVETTLADGLTLRGYVDRLDVAADGRVRVVDYKTGRAPAEAFEAKALFQMKFYALVLWRLRGRIPDLLQLVYLGNGQVLRYVPDETDLTATERKVAALWAAIERAAESGDWRPSPGRLCDWCDHQSRCPARGGVLPSLPVRAETLASVDAVALPPPGLDEEA